MFERLLARLHKTAPKPDPMPQPDAQIALGTLLVRVAMADRAYLFEEVEQIDRVLAHAFGLKPLEAAKLRASCERFSDQLPDDTNLADLIRDEVDYAHRLEMVEGLWAVAHADRVTHVREAEIIRLVEDELGIAPQDNAAARAAAVIP